MMTKIFKTLAFAMLLTTACNKSDVAINNENTDQKGFTLPVTVNVTREGDDPTKATYNDGTKKLSFSEGDKLFVEGEDKRAGGAGKFAGTLDWVSGGTFSGTISTQNTYSGTADELFTAIQSPGYVEATLLPNGYGSYGYFSIEGTGYNAYVSTHYENAFTTTKTLAVEQFCKEIAYPYSNGFALSPYNAILNFTITGLAASTAVEVSLTDNNDNTNSISKSVTTDGSGTATFAVGIEGGRNSNQFSLSVGGNAITLGSHVLSSNKIFNISRNVILANVTASDLGKVIGADGRIYANASAATTASTTAVAMIAYVGNASNCSHGLAIAMSDVSGTYNWSGAITACSDKNTTAAVTGGTWRLPSIVDWQNMLIGCGADGQVNDSPTGSFNMSYSELAAKLSTAGGSALTVNWEYWSATEYNSINAWHLFLIGGNTQFYDDTKTPPSGFPYVRACLAF